MFTESFYRNMFALVEAIEDCLEKRRLIPSLVLLYSGIDVVASLERRQDEGIKAAFTRWVDSYLLKSRSLPCTALELYAARCGIVHSFTADSDLFRKGQVRQILYAVGTAKADDLQAASNILQRKDCITIHIRDLIDAFRQGLADYLEELDQDTSRQQVATNQAGMWFTHMDQQLVQTLVEMHNNKGTL